MRRLVAKIPCAGQQHNKEHINVALANHVMCICHISENTLLIYLQPLGQVLEKKIRAQEEPKSPDAFPGLQICQNCFCGRGCAPDSAGGAYSAPPEP